MTTFQTRPLRNSAEQPNINAPGFSTLVRCRSCEFQQLFLHAEERLALDARDVHSFSYFHDVELLRRLPDRAQTQTRKPTRTSSRSFWQELVEIDGIRLNLSDGRTAGGR